MIERVRQIAQELLARLRGVDEKLRSSNQADESLYTTISDVFDNSLSQLARLNLWGTQNQLPSSELWNAAGHLLERGWLQNRARTKPRGYAGDWEMIGRIQDETLCDDPLGRLFDRYFQDQAAPRAVRNRMQLMTEWICDSVRECEGPFRVSFAGSALGVEIRDALHSMDVLDRERVSAILLDLDPAALDYAQSQLRWLLPPERLILASENLFRLPDRTRAANQLANSNLLLCPGLFDYLEDEAAVKMLRVFWERLAPDGRLAVFQFAPHNPTRGYMEWFGNWYLIYRNQRQLADLAAAAGIPDGQIELGAEATGTDLFLVARRT